MPGKRDEKDRKINLLMTG